MDLPHSKPSNRAPVRYAEDQADDAFFMRNAWELAGLHRHHPLIVVDNGQMAVNYLAGKGPYANRATFPLPCLLLLDLNLPLMSGFEVLRWVRTQLPLKSLRVVIVSGSNMDTDLLVAQKLGVIDYLVKPSTPSSLTHILEEKKQLWFGKKQ